MAEAATTRELGAITVSGLVAGIIMAAFDIVATAAVIGVGAATTPLRMIAAILLGRAALRPDYSLALVVPAALVLHLALSVLFTGIFAVVIDAVSAATRRELVSTPGSITLAGVLFGIVLWLINFFVIAPAAGWTWFSEGDHQVIQLAAHTVFFGAPMGWMFWRLRVPRSLRHV